MKLACAALATLALLTGIPDSHAAGPEWPGWRGPRRNDLSRETGLASSWPKGGPPLAWKAAGMGSGFSSVAVVDGRIYTLGDRSDAQYLLAFSADTGAPLWAARIGAPNPGDTGGPHGTPMVEAGTAVALGTAGDLVAVDAVSGKELWRRNLHGDFGGNMMSGWGWSESPLIDGDRVIVTPGGKDAALVALDKATGKEIWRSAVPSLGPAGGDGAAYSSVVITEAAGERQYVQLLGRGLVGVRASDGQFLWGYNRVANSTANISTPIVRANWVFDSTGYGTGSALVELVKKDDGGVEAREAYFLEPKAFQNHHGGMVLVGNHVYAGHGQNRGDPICVELMTGKVAWRGDPKHGGTGSAAVTYADGQLYFRYQNGVMALVAASPDDYHENGSFTIPGVVQPSWSHPVVVGGHLYLREQDILYVYDVRKPA